MPRPAKRLSTSKTLWTPDSGITYSALSLFLQCREQFRLAYVYGWSPKSVSDSIEFGSIFHHFCEHYDFHKPIDQLTKIRNNLLAYRRKNNQDVGEEYNALLDKAQVVFRCYTRHQPNKQLIWFAREEQFSVPVKITISRSDPNHLHPLLYQDSGGVGVFPTINLRGKRDGIFSYAETPDELWLFETKTKSIIDEQGLLGALASDMQTLLYAYATKLQHPDKKIVGALYNVVRNPQSKQRKTESRLEFLSRLEETIEENPAHYFYRQNITYHEQDLITWPDKVLKPMLFQLWEWWEALNTAPSTPHIPNTPLHFQNPNALYSQYGRCHLFDLLTTGNPFMFKQRKEVFPELAE
jgi:hypothetical protein